MKDPNQVLQQKEADLARNRKAISAGSDLRCYAAFFLRC
jgi:hypothetical protein